MGGLYIEREDQTLKVKRRNKSVEIGFPVIGSKEIKLAISYLQKYLQQAHNRPILDTIDILDQIHHTWINPNFELRKEAVEVLSLITGQSKTLVNLEMNEILRLFRKDHLVDFLFQQLGDLNYLDTWVENGDTLIHAQPRGIVLHSLAGNAFVIGPISMLFGILTKNLNLIKLASSEPYFAVRFVQSIFDIDRKLARELAVMYWRGSEKNIYEFLFNEELVDVVTAWGGLTSVRQLKKLSAFYGVKFIEHGPKFSFSVITEDYLNNKERISAIANEIAKDLTIWNQYACCSPRIVFVQEKDEDKLYEDNTGLQNEIINCMKEINNSKMPHESNVSSSTDSKLLSLMSESMGMLRKTLTDNSALGFAKILSIELNAISKILARAEMTEAEAIETLNKRDFYTLNIESKGWGKLFVPKDSKLTQNPDWTVLYLRRLPDTKDIDACFNRFAIVTPFKDLKEIEDWINRMKIKKYLQTFSIIGNMEEVKEISDRLTFLGGCTMTLPGEMNIHKASAPHDGGFDLKELVRWVSINYFADDLKKFDK